MRALGAARGASRGGARGRPRVAWRGAAGPAVALAAAALLVLPALLAPLADGAARAAFLQQPAAPAAAAPAVGARGVGEGAPPARRSLLGGALAGGFGLAAGVGSAPVPAGAAEGPKVTAQCQFLIRIGYDKTLPLRRVVIDVYGEEAPVLAKTFMQACTGTYPGKGGISGRYQLATMSSVSKDRMLGFANFPGGNFLAKKNPAAAGEFLEKIPLAGSDTKTDEVNQLRHDQVGRVSMSKGGGSFNFVISPVKDAPWLDEQQRVVMGQVSEGLDVIAELNNLKGYEKGGSILQFLPEPPGKGSSNAYLKDYLLVPDEKVQIWKSKDLTNNVETKLLL